MAIAEAATFDSVNELMGEEVKAYLEASWKKLGEVMTIKGRRGEYICIQTFVAEWGTCVPLCDEE